MPKLLYIDSSLWSRLIDPPESAKRRIAQAFLQSARKRYRLVVSSVVIDELNKTKDLPARAALLDALAAMGAELLVRSAEAETVAWELLAAGRWTERRLADMTHVAYAMLSEADALLTWDTDDLARERTRTVVHAYAMREGLRAPLIGTPEEVSAWLDVRIQ